MNREVQNLTKHFGSTTTVQCRLKNSLVGEIVNPLKAIPIFWRAKVKQIPLPEGCRQDKLKSCRSAKLVTIVTGARSDHFALGVCESDHTFVTVCRVSCTELFNMLQWVWDSVGCKQIGTKDRGANGQIFLSCRSAQARHSHRNLQLYTVSHPL